MALFCLICLYFFIFCYLFVSSSCCLESPTAILPSPLPPDCGIIFKFKFAAWQTANTKYSRYKYKMQNLEQKCKIRQFSYICEKSEPLCSYFTTGDVEIRLISGRRCLKAKVIMTSFCTVQNFEWRIYIKMSCSEIYQIEISESKLIIIFWKVFNVIQRWYMSSFHIVSIWKSEFERIHCHGRVEWDQIEFETKWGNKAEFMETSHICPSPSFKITYIQCVVAFFLDPLVLYIGQEQADTPRRRRAAPSPAFSYTTCKKSKCISF